MKSSLAFAAAAVALLCAVAVQAQVVGLNLTSANNGNTPTFTGAGVLGISGSNFWNTANSGNNVSVDVTLTKDATGANLTKAPTVRFSNNSGDQILNYNSTSGAVATNAQALMSGYWYSAGANAPTGANITLSNLTNNGWYNLVFYRGDALSAAQSSAWTIGGVTKTAIPTLTAHTLTENNDYVLFNAVQASGSGTIGVLWSSTNTAGALIMGGMQIAAITSGSYTLAATTGTSAIRVGGTASITATLTNTAGGSADSIAVSGLGASVSPSGSVTISPNSGTAALSGLVSGSGDFTPSTGGLYTFTPSVTSAVNALIGGAATATGTTTATVSVYNYAAANSISGTVDFGVVLKNTPLSQELAISNTAPNNGYSEKLNAAFGTPTGQASGDGTWSLLAADDTSTALSVSLATGSAGAASGSVPVNFTSDGDGTSGLGSVGIGMQTVDVTATVLDAALASFTSGSTQTSLSIDFGTVNQGDVVSAQAFSLYDLMQTIGYTADLALIEVFPGTENTGALGTNLATFSSLAAGSSSAWEATVNTANEGTFTNTWTLEFKSANGGTVFLGDPSQFLTLTTNVLVVPEPGTLVLAGIGVIAVGAAARRRRRS